MERGTDFIFLGFKITADGDCSHEIKRHLLLGRKTMINLNSVLKSRNITLPTKVHLVKAMVFPIVMYGCEIWTVKMAEHWRTNAFELWCWEAWHAAAHGVPNSWNQLCNRTELNTPSTQTSLTIEISSYFTSHLLRYWLHFCLDDLKYS